MAYDPKKYKALCAAAKDLKLVCDNNESYGEILKATLKPFTRVDRSIGLSTVRARDFDAATAALNKRTREITDSQLSIDALSAVATGEHADIIVRLSERIERLTRQLNAYKEAVELAKPIMERFSGIVVPELFFETLKSVENE